MQPDLLMLSEGCATKRPARPRMAGLPWGEVSKWVALLTLTLVGVMEYRGMLRRPVGLLPTPLQRASSVPLVWASRGLNLLQGRPRPPLPLFQQWSRAAWRRGYAVAFRPTRWAWWRRPGMHRIILRSSNWAKGLNYPLIGRGGARFVEWTATGSCPGQRSLEPGPWVIRGAAARARYGAHADHALQVPVVRGEHQEWGASTGE
jgi:hypothetical protein